MARKTVSEEHKKEVHKRNNVKWDRENMRSLSCRVRTEQADIFKQYCAEYNTTPGRIIKDFVLSLIDEYTKKDSSVKKK